MQDAAAVLPDGGKPLASAQARLLGDPPSWATRGTGPIPPVLILVGLVTGQKLLQGIATILMLVLIGTFVLYFTVWRKHVTVALATDALYVTDQNGSARYPLTSLVSVKEAVAKVGPNTVTVEFAGHDTISFTWAPSSDTAMISSE